MTTATLHDATTDQLDFEPEDEHERFAAALNRLTLKEVASILARGCVSDEVAARIGVEAGSPLAARITHACRSIARAARSEALRLVGVADGRFPF